MSGPADATAGVSARSVRTPALYRCTLRHVRTGPVRNDFTYRTWLWFVDLDEIPRLPGPLRLLGTVPDAATLRAEIDGYLAGHGVELGGGRVTMLAAPRAFGHVFNPLTVFWCHDRDGALVRVIAQVHNTYGGRHRYLLTPDVHDRSNAVKEFYVSPFYPVAGSYRLTLPEPDARLNATIRFQPPDGAAPFVAVLRGERRALTTGTVLRQALSQPAPTLLTAARIRLQGVRLYLRGLPVLPRTGNGECDRHG